MRIRFWRRPQPEPPRPDRFAIAFAVLEHDVLGTELQPWTYPWLAVGLRALGNAGIRVGSEDEQP